MRKKLTWIVCILFLVTLMPIHASEKYSFEKAEELKPLIEWRDYGPDAFAEAAQSNKPLFLLLTAPSWCYWCQVYESEDYLFNTEIYTFINENMIPVYVDADQRQDLTRHYLEGGWPSTTVLTPDKQRLFGYSGPRPIENMLDNMQRAVEHVKTINTPLIVEYKYEKRDPFVPSFFALQNFVNEFENNARNSYDSTFGGFGNGQKFPQGRTLLMFLEKYEDTNDQEWLQMVQNTLYNQYTNPEKLHSDYNLFDPIEGGFHRYGTTRDWSPPHYEKMLYDNARLLRAYYKLTTITPDDPIAQEVVDKTLEYIDTEWYDHEKGGFYGNTDVAGEDAYYGKKDRSGARVEKTKYTDWNAQALLAYLELYEHTPNEEHKKKITQTLDFYQNEMITNEGLYHYMSPDGTKGVRGNLLDNAYMVLAFTRAYEVLNDESYLATAQQILDYLYNFLYDWNAGGFFERNSPDTNLYAPGEHIILSKPSQENGIMAYSLLLLYQHNKDPYHLVTALKTMGANLDSMSSLDRGMYYYWSARHIVKNNIHQQFQSEQERIKDEEKVRAQTMWLHGLLENDPIAIEFRPSSEGIESPQSPFLLLLLVSFIAGLLSFVSPCTLPILPAFIAYSFKSTQKNVRGMTLAFIIGLVSVFALLGVAASFAGGALRVHAQVIMPFAGAAILLLGCFLFFGGTLQGPHVKANRPHNYVGAAILGATLGVSWTPCVGPILVAILLLASQSATVVQGGFFLIAYGIGLGIPLLIVARYLSTIDRNSRIWKIVRGKEWNLGTLQVHSSSAIAGILFIIIGYFIFTGTLYSFNQYVSGLGVQKLFFAIEEFLLNLIS